MTFTRDHGGNRAETAQRSLWEALRRVLGGFPGVEHVLGGSLYGGRSSDGALRRPPPPGCFPLGSPGRLYWRAAIEASGPFWASPSLGVAIL